MSLRSKIIWLFVGLAVLPVLVLGAFGYWHAQNLLGGTVTDNLRASTTRIERSLTSRLGDLQHTVDRWSTGSWDELEGTGALPGKRSGSGSGAKDTEPLVSPDGPLVLLRLEDRQGALLAQIGEPPATSFRCSGGVGSRITEMVRAVPSSRGAVSASFAFWSSSLIDRARLPGDHSVMVVDRSDGTVVYSDRCDVLRAGSSILPDAAGAPALAAGDRMREFQFRSGGERHFGVFLDVSDLPWRVVATTSPTAVLAPLGQLHISYWAFVLVLALSTVLAFSMLLGRVTRSLRDLTRAAEEIGKGELDPWLPVPGGGEVGQLTEAFSRMLERIRQMMAQVNQNGRLAVVGQMSAYLAHEIRNPLSSIKLNLQRLQRWTRSRQLPEFCAEPIEISLKEVNRLAAAVSGVLQLSRNNDRPRELLSLHSLTQEAVELLSEKARRHNVDLRLRLDAEADRIRARPGQVKSVVVNLMVNAMEAQPEGGFLTVESKLVKGREGEGPLVALRFRDGGSGVPKEIRERIFEPFFTTKEAGSGIGLAVALQGVLENGGRLLLEETPESRAGAEFVMAFPLASAGEPEKEPVRAGWIHDAPAWPLRRSTDSPRSSANPSDGEEAGRSVPVGSNGPPPLSELQEAE
jgi:signal transduction histidine kinase